MGASGILTTVTGIPPGLEPRVIYIQTDNTLEEVQAENYLTDAQISLNGIENNDIAAVSGINFVNGLPATLWFSVIITPTSNHLRLVSSAQSSTGIALVFGR